MRGDPLSQGLMYRTLQGIIQVGLPTEDKGEAV